MEYEYVSRSEYRPIREELEAIIHRVQKFMRKKYKTTFQYRLIGSGKKHLITREIGGNKGYDFDYNLILPTLDEGYHYIAKVVKEQFLEAFRFAVKGTNYKAPEDSTSVLTIKVVDHTQGRILHSCDFAIIYYRTEDVDDGYMYLMNWKNGTYSFEKRDLSHKADYKLYAILECSDGWKFIREEYLKLKNSNRDPDKHSYILYLEAINNVYNLIGLRKGESNEQRTRSIK